MRQELLAGLIVVTFGLPVAIIADGKELARELGAIELAVKGNPAPFKKIWVGPQTVALPAPQVDPLDGILKSGAQALAEAQTARRLVYHSVESQVMIRHPVPMSKDDIFVLAGAELQLASHQLAGLNTVAVAVAKLDTGDRFQGPVMRTHQAVRLAAAVADEFSIAAYAEPAPAARGPHARRRAATTVAVAADGPWINQRPVRQDDDAVTADASTDEDAVQTATAEDTTGNGAASDGFQQVGAISGGFTSAVPEQTSVGGLTDITTATR